MTLEQAKRGACREAMEYGVTLNVVLDRYSETPEAPFGYAPVGEATRLLYRGAEVIGYAMPDGSYQDAT